MTITAESVQQALPVFAVKNTGLATGDEVILDRPTHHGSLHNLGAIYLHPADSRVRWTLDDSGQLTYVLVRYHRVRYLNGPAEGLVDEVREDLLIERITPEGDIEEI